MAAELPRFAFAACVDRLLEQEDEIDEAAVMVVSVDDLTNKKGLLSFSALKWDWFRQCAQNVCRKRSAKLEEQRRHFAKSARA
ncbi:MAG: hypothetical protein E5Y32_03570 [Mesorhizobium sp.]|nr:MAG: hypothetical protein E5Y32_03570 [Mesorhizobium sp.]